MLAFVPKIGFHCYLASVFQTHASWILMSSFNRIESLGNFSVLHLINSTDRLQDARMPLGVQLEGSGITQEPSTALFSL